VLITRVSMDTSTYDNVHVHTLLDFLFGTKLYLSNLVTMLVEPTKFHYGISCALVLKVYMKKKVTH
jgi:hypothetical protein